MTFGELLAALLGWLGDFIEWIISFVPKYVIIRCNEKMIKFPASKNAIEKGPGIYWYWPIVTEVYRIFTARHTLEVEYMTLETLDELPIVIGLVMTVHITNATKYIVENVDAEDGIVEVASGTLRDIVMENDWNSLVHAADDGKRLNQKLTRRLGESLKKFGIKVESARPTDQVRVRAAYRFFGNTPIEE